MLEELEKQHDYQQKLEDKMEQVEKYFVTLDQVCALVCVRAHTCVSVICVDTDTDTKNTHMNAGTAQSRHRHG